jgi:hypothetical protein
MSEKSHCVFITAALVSNGYCNNLCLFLQYDSEGDKWALINRYSKSASEIAGTLTSFASPPQNGLAIECRLIVEHHNRKVFAVLMAGRSPLIVLFHILGYELLDSNEKWNRVKSRENPDRDSDFAILY